MQALRVLLIDDDEEDAALTRRMLSRASHIHCDVTWVDSFEAAEDSIKSCAHDVILLDYRLDRGTGIELVKRTGAADGSAPVILLTGQREPELDMAALAAGVVDFLEKGNLEAQQLERSIRYAIDRKRIEGELRSSHAFLSHAFLRSIMDALPDHLAIIDSDGRLIAVNESWMQFVRRNQRLDTELTIGDSCTEVCASHAAPEDAQMAAQGIREVREGTRALFEMDYSCVDDSAQRWFSMRVTPFSPSDAGSVVITHSDVTSHKQLEDQLRHAQKMEAISQLAGGIAHDFNNLLTVITGCAELLLLELPAGAPQRQDAEQIESAAAKAANLTRQLLAFSRKDAVSPRVFDLNAQLVELEAMLSRLIREDVHLVLSLGEGPLPIKIDPTQLEQIVMNLVLNGRDAMPDGGTVAIETSASEIRPGSQEVGVGLLPGNYVTLVVGDTGVGMDAETSNRIFEPFFTTKGVGKGTGLGLSTVFGIVSRVGGSIRVHTRPSLGTTFKLYFPLASASEIEEDQVLSDRQPPERASARILFVEDQSSLRELGQRILARIGYEVCVAENGKRALQICERDSGGFDLAIIDVIMPEMGGVALAERLRRAYPEIKIIMTSGYTGMEVVTRGTSDGALPFIEKPYTPDGLIAKVWEVLSTRAPTPSVSRRLA